MRMKRKRTESISKGMIKERAYLQVPKLWFA